MKHYQRITIFICILLFIWGLNTLFDMMNTRNTVENNIAYILLIVMVYVSVISQMGYKWITWLVNKFKK